MKIPHTILALTLLAAALTQRPAPAQPILLGDPPREVAEVRARPEATAEPTPDAPPPAPPAPKPFTPPLSLNDCQRLLDELVAEVAATAEEPSEAQRDRRLRVAQEVARYLRDRDNIHGTLNEYRWDLLIRSKVADSEVDRDAFDFTPPRRRISVLSFEAEGADVLIEDVRVFDEHNRVVDGFRTQPQEDWTVETSLPRRETLHFWRRTSISRVEVTYRQLRRTSTLPVRLYIYGGESEQREFAKMAIFQLDLAREKMAAGETAAALELLREAREHIGSYREVRRGARN